LSAFLEDIGYKKSKEIHDNLRCQKNSSIRLPPDDFIEQIFQFAWLEATNPIHFFRNFKEEEPSLVRYANSTMKRRIKDQLFGSQYPTITYTRYGLLRKLGEGERKRKEALELQGYKNYTISNLLLAWECFYQICTPNRQGKIDPKTEHWHAIASQYNQLRQEPNRIVNWQSIQNWIDNYCIPAARNYLAHRFISIDTLNKDTHEQNLDLPDALSPSPYDLLEQGEMKEILKRLWTEFDFSKFIQNLKPEDQKLLLLRYGLKLRQVDIAEEFHWYTGKRPDNSRVSKAEDRIFRELAKAISSWVVMSKIKQRENLGVINSEWLKKMDIKSACETLMKKYYYSPVKSIMDEARFALEQQQSDGEGNNRLADQQILIKNYIVNQLQTSFNITLPPNGHATIKISSLLEDLLKTAQY
jgi:hypothetical protein